MPPSNPRKRAAPGSSPVQTPQMQQYPATSQLSNAEFLRWSGGPDAQNYPEAGTFNMNSYGDVAGMSQPQYEPSVPAPSTQLARRPVNRQLVQTAQRTTFDNTTDPWGQFGDDSILDPQNAIMEESDSIELLEEKAAVAKKDAQSKRKQIPPFVQKLSSFLDESKNTELIRWSDRGDSFVVLDEDEFAKTLIPELFKHNNYASFVRQLNMYGFHKRVGLSDNSMKASERKNKSPSEYYNPYFKRGHPNLLWLINKPKSGSKATPGSKRPKTEEKQDGSDDDGQDIEETFYNNQASRALSAAPEAGPLQRREIANIHNEISEIKKNQGIIMNSIGRIRKDHAHLLNQALTFQGLHDRHESSINAILTFLATVYNRSLDGQNPVNLGQMFANGITPQDQQQNQGNVVDLGELAGQQQQQAQQPAGNISPNRRNQLLLMAPPNAANRGQTASPSASTPQAGYGNTNMSGSVEELFDSNSPADSTQIKAEQDQATMMNLINNTNAQVGNNSNGMEFPEMLSHYENANGNSPLTPDQRSTMLNMMASQASAPGTNNALVSPSPDTPDMVQTLAELGYTGREIDDIARLSVENGHKITKLHNAYVTPLSPSGSIPGLNDAAYFNGAEPADPNLDLDQYLESGAFYNGSSPLGGYSGGEGGYDPYNDLGASANGDIDLFAEGVHDGSRIVETAGSSEVGTPEAQREDVNVNGVVGGGDGDLKSPSKKRRRN